MFLPSEFSLCALSVSTVLGILRHWSRSSSLCLHLPLWNIPEEREGAAGNRREQLWPPSRSYREVSCGVLFQLQFTHFILQVDIHLFPVSGISTWRNRSTSTQQFMVTSVVTSFHGRWPRSWNTDTPTRHPPTSPQSPPPNPPPHPPSRVHHWLPSSVSY